MRWREVLAGLGATLAFSALAQARTKNLECSAARPQAAMTLLLRPAET